MLVLTRHIGESLIINNTVTVKILGIKDNQIRLGIDAPPNIPIHREEIFKKLQAEGKTMIEEGHNAN